MKIEREGLKNYIYIDKVTETPELGYSISLNDHKDEGINTKPCYFEFQRNEEKIKVSNKEVFELLKILFSLKNENYVAL